MARYFLRLRPLASAHLPAGVGWTLVERPASFADHGLRSDLPVSRRFYGSFETDRLLTADEMDHFDVAHDD